MRPSRSIVLFPIIACLAVVFVFLPPFSGPASGEDLLQCMEKCIRYEGGNTDANKDTCKFRCANTSTKGQGGMRDCMGEFKACKKNCGKDNACYKVCKKAQMKCV